MYDIETYSDEELYQLLNLNHPTDRELEAKIYMMMDEHKDNEQVHNFFVDVFKHFFDTETDQEETTDSLPSFSQLITDGVSSFLGKHKEEKEGFQIQPAAAPDTTTSTSTTVNTESYTQGKLNPLLKETIKRVISIDSQFRDTKVYPYSTAFTFNLSEPLRNVVSMKLYSIQIPYTWYTINHDFASNVFYLKGNAPGINNGNFDYGISIPSGNYQSADFTKYINASFLDVSSAHPDVLFGNTAVSYDSPSSKMSMAIDLQNIYNESNYALIFPTSSFTPYSPTNPIITSIPQLLGYNFSSYQPTSIHSDPVSNARANNREYTLSTASHTFYLCFYQGPDPYTPTQDTSMNTTYVTARIPITLSLTPNSYTSTQLMNNLSQQLSTHAYLDPTSNITMIPSPVQQTFQYQLTLVPLRTMIPHGQYMKPVVIFPPEVSATPLWTGSESCFQFTSVIQELSNIVSENASEITTYYIQDSPRICLKCIAPYYQDHNGNDHYIVVPNSTSTGYSVPQYLEAIQQGMNALNVSTYHAFHAWIDISNSSSIPTMKFNINHVLDTTQFMLDITGSILDLTFRFPTIISETVKNTRLPGFFVQQGYIIYDYEYAQTLPNPSTLPTNRLLIHSIGSNNQYVPVTVVDIPIPGGGVVGSYVDIMTMIQQINAAFSRVRSTNHTDNSYNNIDLTNTHLTLSSISLSGLISCQFNMNVQAALCEKDFLVLLQDPCGNSWNQCLNFQETMYSFVDSLNSRAYSSTLGYAQITANESLYSNQLLLTNDNHSFQLTPIYNAQGGVHTGDTTWNIPITLSLPVNQSYTKEQIVANMNQQLQQNPLTRGLKVDISRRNTVFRLTIHMRALVAFVGDEHRQGQLLMTERPAPYIYYLKPTVA